MEVNEKRGIFAPNKLIAVLSYVIFMFIIGTLLIYLIAIIYSNISNDVDYNILIKYMSNKADIDGINEKTYQDALSLVQGISNFIAYGLSFLFVVFYLRDELKNAFISLKNNKLLQILIPIMGITFCLLTYLIDYLVGLAVESSQNQSTIVAIMNGPGLIPMIIATIIFAPIVEELIYRNVIFHYAKKYSIIACYVISTLLFVLPHMITSDISNIGIWFLQAIPYVFSGVLLCAIYHISKYNIYASICAHVLNNILALILVLVI